MPRRNFFASFFLQFFLVFALMSISCSQSSEPAVSGASDSPATPQPKEDTTASRLDESATQTYSGVQVTVISIQRAREIEVMPNFPEKMRAKPGHEFASLTLRVKVLEAERIWKSVS